MKPLALALSFTLLVQMSPAAAPPGAAQNAGARPRLVVLLVVDQMRSEYLVQYRPLFTRGINRLLKEGAWFRQGAYPYLNTVTCAGHSTLGTGSFPYRHGMVLNAWYDRELKGTVTCTADPSSPEIAISDLAPAAGGHSARRLMKPSLASALKKERNGRVVALSLKPRSAITLAGDQADAVAWFDDRGVWMTSEAYGAPPPALKNFVATHPPAADRDEVWTRRLPDRAYQFADEVSEEHPVIGWDRTFPHPLLEADAPADAGFYTRWQRSPYSDEYLGRMAAALVDGLSLGQRDAVDFLGISFSALDMAGHNYGPRSHEVQDILVRLDATIGRILEHLDARVGRGNYVLGLSADHGVSEIPEQLPGGGRLTAAAIAKPLEAVLQAALGPGEHVVSSQYTDHYLSPAAAARIREDRKLRESLLEAVRGVDGVETAYYGPDLATAEARQSKDRVRRAAALSYYPGRSGDLIVVPKSGWITSTAAATHGSHHGYDQRVPVIFYGFGVKPGAYDDPATPADIAATLAAAAGVHLDEIDGRALPVRVHGSGN